MPLEFRSAASMDPPRRGVRFAGHPISSRHSPMVICEISTEALRLLGEIPDASSEELMGVFEIYRETILAIASRKFDKGDLRPRITDRDIEIHAGWNTEFLDRIRDRLAPILALQLRYHQAEIEESLYKRL